jgi:hypothetical protein
MIINNMFDSEMFAKMYKYKNRDGFECPICGDFFGYQDAQFNIECPSGYTEFELSFKISHYHVEEDVSIVMTYPIITIAGPRGRLSLSGDKMDKVLTPFLDDYHCVLNSDQPEIQFKEDIPVSMLWEIYKDPSILSMISFR